METLDERYRSRFVWGLIADIGQPDYETRMAILKKKKEKLNIEYMDSISDEVIDYIAKNVTSNVRELEGALNKLILFSNSLNFSNPLLSSLSASVSITGPHIISPIPFFIFSNFTANESITHFDSSSIILLSYDVISSFSVRRLSSSEI